MYHERFQRLLQNLESSIVIGRNGPSVNIDLTNLPEYNSVVDHNGLSTLTIDTENSMMGRMSISLPTMSSRNPMGSVNNSHVDGSLGDTNNIDSTEVRQMADLINFNQHASRANTGINNAPTANNIDFTPAHNSSLSRNPVRTSVEHNNSLIAG